MEITSPYSPKKRARWIHQNSMIESYRESYQYEHQFRELARACRLAAYIRTYYTPKQAWALMLTAYAKWMHYPTSSQQSTIYCMVHLALRDALMGKDREARQAHKSWDAYNKAIDAVHYRVSNEKDYYEIPCHNCKRMVRSDDADYYIDFTEHRDYCSKQCYVLKKYGNLLPRL